MGTDEAEGEADGRVTHDRRDHQAQEHLDRRVPVNPLILIVLLLVFKLRLKYF